MPEDYFALSEQARECGLRFAVFDDGCTEEGGFVVFGIESVDFSDVVKYKYKG